MAKDTASPYWTQKRWYSGTANFIKEDLQNAFYYSQSIDYRSDAMALTLLPASLKESASVVTDFVKWFDLTPENLDVYALGDTGNLYRRTTSGAWNNVHIYPNNHGNGLSYFYGDDYVYIANDATIGRYGPIKYVPTIIEDWLTGAFSASKWNRNFSTGLETIQTGQVTMTVQSGTTVSGNIQEYVTTNTTNNRVILNLKSAGNQSLASWSCGFDLFTNPAQTNGFGISIKGGNIVSQKIIAGVTTNLNTTAYNATAMAYLAIGESNGSLIFEYSPDGISFTQLTSFTNPFGTNLFYLIFGAGTGSNEASTTSAVFGAFTLATRLGVAQATNDFLAAVGGIPQNTASLLLASSSSMYATATSSSSLQIVSDITLETYIKANSFPAVGSSMTLLGKWDESGATRSYKLDLYGVSGFFGSGADGALTISTNTTDSPIDSSASAASGTQQIFATNASFAVGQIVLLIQMQGTNAGQWEFATIQSYTAGTITTTAPLKGTYTNASPSVAQVLVVKQYTNVTVNSGITWTAKAWNGATGGILIFFYSGTLSGSGTINANACGFRGGTSSVDNSNQTQGEGYLGLGSHSAAANANGGGAGMDFENNAAGGGGNGTSGGTGTARPGKSTNNSGVGGSIAGSADLTSMILGGGGGASAYGGGHGGAGINGANGGGLIVPMGVTFNFTGTITANGATGTAVFEGASGSGAGGSINIKSQTLGSGATITAIGGAAVAGGGSPVVTSGAGGNGRIAIAYLTANAATSTPTAVSQQDNTLVTSTTIQARLGISANGTASEYLTQNLSGLTTGSWNRISVSWVAALSQASFYLNGTLLGTAKGTLTAINSNTAALTVGANNGGSGITNFFNGELNDMRIIANAQTASQIFANNQVQLSATYSGLKAYWKFNSVYTDTTANANTLTAVNSPTFVNDVPFPYPTTRLDIDQSSTATGSTYALKASISEAAADQLSFTPALDPQKSVDFNISSLGTGPITVTVHDQQNNIIAQKTVPVAQLPASGFYEFFFDVPWRIVINKSYHMHVTQTTADGTLVSSSSNNLQTAVFHTYYGFLVSDQTFHPIARFLNKIVIGNERYLAIWDGATYQANFIAFPQGTHVRCFGFWREFLAIGVWQENAAGQGNIYDYPTGTIYFWDGIQLTFNFSETIAEGQPNALLGIDTNLYIWAGGNGYLTMYQGGYIYASGNSPTMKVKKMPFLERNAYMEIYPQGMAFYRSLIHIGSAANSNSSTLPKGTWSWGTLNNLYPESLSYDYPISTGNIGNTVSIGAVFAAPNNTFLQSWKDGNAYGVDQVNMSNPVAKQGIISTLILDNNDIYHQEQAMKVRADHLSLATGQGIQVGYQIDRAGLFTYTNSITDAQTKIFTEQSIQNGRGREFELSAILTSTNGISPTLLGLSLLQDVLATEKQF